jgi:hypothetical protein
MKSLAFIFPLAAGAVLCAQSPEWDRAMAQARQLLGKGGGQACVVMLERADANTVKIRLQVLGTSIREASFTGLGETTSVRGLELDSPKGMDQLQGSAMLNEQIHSMDVILKGEDFRPRLRMRVPKQGDKPETAIVVAGVAPPK